MEARTLLQKIRQRGFNIEAIGNDISLAPKKLLNEQIINFVRKHKNQLLTALYQEQDKQKDLHLKHKRTLHEGRLEIFRLILRRYYQPSNLSKIEEFLDGALIQFNYDLEKAIDYYRKITPEPILIDGRCQCGYMPPFCNCK